MRSRTESLPTCRQPVLLCVGPAGRDVVDVQAVDVTSFWSTRAPATEPVSVTPGCIVKSASRIVPLLHRKIVEGFTSKVLPTVALVVSMVTSEFEAVTSTVDTCVPTLRTLHSECGSVDTVR